MAVQLAVLFLVAVWLTAWVSKRWRSEKPPVKESFKPPVHSSWVPYLGPIVNIATKGSNLYISSLCAKQRSPIATLRLPGQDMHLMHPLDSASIKHFTNMRHLSLMAVFHIAVGPAMALVPASDKFLTQPDTGNFKRDLSKLFNGELRTLQNLQHHASQLQAKIDSHWDLTIAKTEGSILNVGLGAWVFDMLSYSMGAVFWGENGPFTEHVFRQQLRLFIQNLEALRNPITWLIPQEFRSARNQVRRRIDQAVRDEAYGNDDLQDPTLFKRLAHLYEGLDIPQVGYTDCHLVAIVGLMSNVINILTWAFCHVTADSELKHSLLAEIENVADDRSASDLRIDADKLRASCPLLLATWYELLRTYGDSPVARCVSEDTLFDGKYELRKGSIMMTPIHLHNFDPRIWGEDAEKFEPQRFLRDGGQVDKDLVKHLNVFGLPGMHQCPGRYLGLTMTLALLSKALLTFEINPTSDEALKRGIVPNRKETMLGLPVMNRDPNITIRRHSRITSVHVMFDNVKPGW